MTRSIHLAPNYSDWTKSQLIERLEKLQHQIDELRATNTVRRSGQNVTAEVESQHGAIRLNELFLNALENMPVSLALFDADDRFVISNGEFRDFSGIPAEHILPGAKFEDLLRLRVAGGVLSGEIGGDEEEWIAQRMDRHRSPGGAFQVRVAGGWRQVVEARLSDGGTLLTTMDITELKRAERSAAEANSLLNDAIESISDGFILYDADERLALCNKKYREYNPSFQDILVPGVRLEDVIRASAASEGAPLEIDDIDSWTRMRLDDYRAGTGSREILHIDGRWILACERRMRDGSMVGIRTDITGIKRTEIALHDSEERLRDAIENISEAFVLYDADQRFVLANGKFYDFYPSIAEVARPGAKREDVIRTAFEAGTFEGSAENVEHMMEMRFRQHRAAQGSQEQQLADGRWVLSSERKTSSGGNVGIRTDITDRKRAEIILRENEKRFRDYAEASGDWFWETDADLRFTYLSSTVERVVGVAPEWHYGKTREDLLGDRYDRDAWNEHLKALRERRPFRNFAFQ